MVYLYDKQSIDIVVAEWQVTWLIGASQILYMVIISVNYCLCLSVCHIYF